MEQQGTVRIGISGWRYAGWRGVFYPEKLAQRRELEFASRQFPSVELNGSFYSMQRPESFGQWCEQTPDDFQFAIKGSRFITHMKKLRDIEVPLANFFAQGLLRLGPKLGPVLWQFPPQFQFNPDLLASFFQKLPRTHKQAAKLAEMHDHRLDGRDWLKVVNDAPIRHCMEIRHDSFITPEFITLLRTHNIGLVVADTVEWPLLMDVTADFVYCRLHGSKQLYVSGYGPKALDTWAQRVAAWAHGKESPDGKRASTEDAPKLSARDVYVYFDNDSKVRAPFDARNLIKRVDKLLL
ncbi:MAG: DUF72 domain-containing protein [Acidobacteria bacterium]|nr:DUF72 domain-containing protein [Acidobacteriota bacterium]